MKRWEIGIILTLLCGAAVLLVHYPPGQRIIHEIGEVTHAPVKLLFVGDVMLSRDVGDVMAAKKDWAWPFARIASITASADVTFGNLETTISTRGTKGGCGFCFRSDPRATQGLVQAGFDVMSVANNHIWDYGPQAFTDTLAALAASDISYVGGGRDIVEARGGVVRTVRGTRIGYLAYTNLLPVSTQAGPVRAGVNLFDADRMRQDIIALRPKADVVIISFHGGIEYQASHSVQQEQIYHAAIDDGADMVVGHHPHVVEDVERYGKGWIAYSLGNFVFDQNFSPETMRGLMLSVQINNATITDVTQIPIDISRQYQPSLAQ